MRRGTGDLTVTVSKAALIDKIKANREEHRTIFEAALDGFKAQILSNLEDRLAQIKAGKIPSLILHLPQPEDHTADYDRVISMLEMHRSDEIEIGQDDYAMYVMDDWAWKREFAATASNYTQIIS